MAERYQRQIGEQGGQGGYLRDTSSAEAAGAQVASALGGLGQQMDRLSVVIQANKEKQDELDAMAAINDYNRRMNAYLNDPEAGQLNTRKLGDAKGLLMDTETHADDLVKDITSRLGAGAADRFKLREPALRSPYSNRSATYEAGQRKEYEKIEVQSTLEGFVQSVQADPMNDEMMETAIDQGLLVLGDQMKGAPQGAIVNAGKAWASQLEVARIQQVAANDPLKANEMIQSSQYLLPEHKAALAAKVKPEVQRVETQAAVEGIVQKFGIESPQETISWIRENYKGDEEERLVSAYKTRVSELTVREANTRTAQNQAQQDYWDAVFAKDAATGNLDEPTLYAAAEGGNISWKMYESGVEKIRKFATRANIEKRLQAENPDLWASYTPEQRESATMRRFGTTDAERAQALSNLQEGIANGSIDEKNAVSVIDKEYDDMRITKSERDRLIKIAKEFPTEQKTFVKQQHDALAVDFQDMLAPGANTTQAGMAQKIFNEKVLGLDPRSSTYRRDVLQARREAITEVVSAQKPLDAVLKNKNVAREYAEAMERVDSSLQGAKEYAATFTPDAVDLARREPPMQRNQGTADPNFHTNGTRITSMAAGEQFTPSAGRVTSAPTNRPRMKVLIDTHGSYISELSQKYGVPENLIYGLIEQESGGNPAAKSPAGAIGLMQLMPATAKGLGVNPSDPRQNLDGGVRYLAQKLKEYKGNVEYALSAYHSGNVNVNRAMQGKGQLGPYGKKYAPSVIANSKRYVGGGASARSAPTSSPDESARARGRVNADAAQKKAETGTSGDPVADALLSQDPTSDAASGDIVAIGPQNRPPVNQLIPNADEVEL